MADRASSDTSEIRWQKLRRDHIAELAAYDPVILQPIGAIEQHGPHLPVDTDTNSVTEIAERCGQHRWGIDRRSCCPLSHWGLSPYWMPFAGTITLRPETILALFSDIGRSVAAHGFRRMVIINGHGGNSGIIGVPRPRWRTTACARSPCPTGRLMGTELGGITPADHGHIGHARPDRDIDPALSATGPRRPLLPIGYRLD